MQRPRSAGVSRRNPLGRFGSKRSAPGSTTTNNGYGTVRNRRRPKSAQPRRAAKNKHSNDMLQIKSTKYPQQSVKQGKRGPSVVQLSAPLQQHWEEKIDIAGKNLRRRKALESKEREILEREDELTDDSTISETSKMKRDERREQRRKEREERERNDDDHIGQTSAERLNRISHIGATRRKQQGRIGRQQRPHSAIGTRGNRHNMLRPVRSTQNLHASSTNRQRPQSALARMRNPNASAPQLDAPDNLFRTLRPNVPADAVDEMKEEHNATVRDLKSKIFQLERERDEAVVKVREVEVRWQDEKADKQSLLYNIHLLRKRLQLLTAREIENQRQLRTFTKLQPLFKTLQEKFNFGSAEEVVQRFQVLEDAETGHYHKIAAMDDQRRTLERKVADISKSRNDEVAALNTGMYMLNASFFCHPRYISLTRHIESLNRNFPRKG